MKVIHKIIAPSNSIHEEYLTLWIADLEEGKKVFVQMGKDKTEWRRLGEVGEELLLKTGSLDGEEIEPRLHPLAFKGFDIPEKQTH